MSLIPAPTGVRRAIPARGVARETPSNSPASSHFIGSACAHTCERRLVSGVGRAWRVCSTHIFSSTWSAGACLALVGEEVRLSRVPSFPAYAAVQAKNGGGRAYRLATTPHHVSGGCCE